MLQKTFAPRAVSRRTVRVLCAAKPTVPKRSFSQQAGMFCAGAAAALLLAAPAPVMAEEARSLADLMRADFAFVDTNKDGSISPSEISQLSQQVADEQDFTAPSSEVVDFTTKLFDLNQDGRLVVDELLTGLALDSVVSEDAIDESAVAMFDKNGDGSVTMAEWKAPFGELAPGGEQLKEYVFKRVDYLQNNDGKLDLNELGNGLQIMRVLVMGY